LNEHTTSGAERPLLRVIRLSADYETGRNQPVHALQNVSFEIAEQEGLGILGESGSGKSSLAQAVLGLLPQNGAIREGRVEFRGTDLLSAPAGELRRIRGAEIALVSQEPALALNPVLSIGTQMSHVLEAHSRMNRAERKERIAGMLEDVGLTEPERIMRAYPHQLSGGQRQRTAIALALVCRPDLLIADEPLSSLDTVTQAEVLDLLLRLKTDLKLAILFITHNAGVLARLCDRALVMRAGQVIASGRLDQLRATADAYVIGLQFPETTITSRPRPAFNAPSKPVLEVRKASKRFVQQRPFSRKKFVVKGLEDIDLDINQGQTLALIGRSGSGKSTLARCIAGFEQVDSGEILIEALQASIGPQVQLIFQDSGTALNPRFTARELISEPLQIAGKGTPAERTKTALALMEEVGLDPEWSERSAGQFSGGQRQRLALARALAANPKLLILDEALSGLDLPLQAQMLRLLLDLQQRHGLTYLFISHDLSFLPLFADEVAVIHDGKIVERKPAFRLQESTDPIARTLIEASERLHVPGVEAFS